MQTRQIGLTKRNWEGQQPGPENQSLIAHYDDLVNDQFLAWSSKLQMTRMIGRGGQGTVFHAERIGDDGFRLPVAVKVFSPEPYPKPVDYDNDMSRVARISAKVARIQHESLICIHDFLVRDGVRVMIMDCVDGFDLRRLLTPRMFGIVKERVSHKRWAKLQERVVVSGLEQPRLRAQAAISVFRDCLRALSRLHEEDIVHGDIKPANIMVDRNGRAKLVDLGSARDEDSAAQTNGCTPQYAAPSVLAGESPNASTDLISLAYVLLELVAGTQIFRQSQDLDRLMQDKTELAARLDDLLPDDLWARESLFQLIVGILSHERFEFHVDSTMSTAEDCLAFLEHNDLTSKIESEFGIWIEELLELGLQDECSFH